MKKQTNKRKQQTVQSLAVLGNNSILLVAQPQNIWALVQWYFTPVYLHTPHAIQQEILLAVFKPYPICHHLSLPYN